MKKKFLHGLSAVFAYLLLFTLGAAWGVVILLLSSLILEWYGVV